LGCQRLLDRTRRIADNSIQRNVAQLTNGKEMRLRPRRALRIAATALAAVLLLGACSRAARDTSLSEDAQGASPEAYQQALATAVDPVSAAVAGMASARALKALSERLAKAEQATGQAADQLDQVTPPEEVTAEHLDLVQALKQLNGDLGVLRDAVEGRELCASSAVMARLGRAEGLAAVREAGDGLAGTGGEQGYKLGLQVPATPGEQSRRLPNGQFVRPGSRTGKGELTIDNGSDRDTVVTLAVAGRPAFSLYVRNRSKQKVTGIRDGSYQIYYTTGVDWDPKARAFTRECAFERFDDTFKFKTTQSATQVEWTTWSVSLQPVAGGNANTTAVDPGKFPAA